ncbi:MAG TPA: DUF559 domain-containing protein [Solirubrobacteraceae bacterium]|nr:DUF559 domain-containing protein [Solirubrobacteraceae bacterium]
MALALQLRGDGIISHATAARLWDITDVCPATTHALLAGRNAAAQNAALIHRVAAIDPRDIRHRHGIPITAPARSFLDLAGQVPLIETESALAMLRRRSLRADMEIRDALSRLPVNHPGAALVRRLLSRPPGELAMTRSIYERRTRRLLRQAGLPTPLTNQRVAGYERDFVWPAQRLILEFDGWEFHRDRFDEDRRRDAAAVAAGWRVIRITARRLEAEPLMVIAEIAAALARSTAA